MQGRRWLSGAFGLGLVVLALAPGSAWALEAPVIISLEPNEIGSNGSGSVIVHCEHCAAVTSLRFGPVRLRRKETGVLGKGEWKVLSETEIEVNIPFHEHGKAIVRLCVAQGAEEVCSPAVGEPSNTFTILPEVYRNEAATGPGHHVPMIGYGELQLNSPQINTQIECVNLGFGAAWNEAPSGQSNPITGHGEILTWWASGHTPKSSHTELSSRCRFAYNGTEENQPTSPVAWATAEAPLHEVIQEGEVCAQPTKQLIECRIPGEETEIRSVIREVSREPPSVPWNVELTEKSEKLRVQIGLPEECKNSTGPERSELSKCLETSERGPSTSPVRCNIPPTPAPPGCVKVEIVSPPLNLQLEYEGYLEPLVINGAGNGLSPSQWEFEGSATGEPALRLSETPTTEGSTTGDVKVLGAEGRELMSAK